MHCSLSQHFKSDKLWRNYHIYSLLTGVLTAMLVPLYLLEAIKLWNGAIQRIMLGILLLWMEIISIRLFRISTSQTIKE